MSKYNEIKVALLGAGTVGGGVYKLIEKRKSEMPSKIQAELTITKVLVKNLNKKREGIHASAEGLTVVDIMAPVIS